MAKSLGLRSYQSRYRRVGCDKYPIGISPSVLKKAIQEHPKVFIFDIDGTLTNESSRRVSRLRRLRSGVERSLNPSVGIASHSSAGDD